MMSKLLEKIVAEQMQHDIVKHELISTMQFGGQSHSSCLDAGLTLIHDVQCAHSVGLKCGIVLFDVKGFFDHVNHDWLVSILINQGYPKTQACWTVSFHKDCKVSMHFNGITSQETRQPVGVLQGLPLSPVLLVTYMLSLLLKMRNWNNSSLGMYVDNNILFACAAEWSDVTWLLMVCYSVCDEWLRRSGLAIELEKMELLFFQKPRE
jgi:hypothetical protein